MKYLKSVKITITNCTQCPNCKTTLTKGFGYAEDYYCKIAKRPNGIDAPGPVGSRLEGRTISGYVEWGNEGPQDHQIPIWCPLKKGNK